MNKPARTALACAVMLATLFAGSIKGIRGFQPDLFASQDGSFETRWPKSFKDRWPPQKSRFKPRTAPIPGMIHHARLPMVLIVEKEQPRLIIPSSTCPPRKGETGSCVLDGAIKPY